MGERIDYVPSPTVWVADHVEAIVHSGTTDAATVLDRPVVLLTMIGARSGATRLVPLMRVEDNGTYAAVGSKGGDPRDPLWVANLRAHPDISLQDGTDRAEVTAREITGAERDLWWPRCVAAYPPYAEYAERTDRTIPVFLLEPRRS
ncbi:MAG: nitroreductase family deazaflavin-dependent oxidoreductase [Nostocoides sp.]